MSIIFVYMAITEAIIISYNENFFEDRVSPIEAQSSDMAGIVDPYRTTTLQLALPSHVIRRRFDYQMQGSFWGSEETGLRN